MKVLDRETRDKYVVTVVATDNGTPVSTASTTVYISVLDANDNTPTFSKQVCEIARFKLSTFNFYASHMPKIYFKNCFPSL